MRRRERESELVGGRERERERERKKEKKRGEEKEALSLVVLQQAFSGQDTERVGCGKRAQDKTFCFYFMTLDTGPKKPLRLGLSDTKNREIDGPGAPPVDPG